MSGLPASAVDKDDTNGYNNTRGDKDARTDEFRNLQAESQRMSDDEIQSYRSGNRKIDDGLRANIARILRAQINSQRNGIRDGNELLKLSAKGNQFNIYENVDGALFHDVFEIARKYLRNGELVDLHGIETTEDGIGYDDCYNYLSEDGLSGFSITPDGDLISVFNASDKGGFLSAIAPIVKERAKTLDCYNSLNQPLMGMYQKIFGFKTASLMDYNMDFDHDNIAENHGKPLIAFMVNTEADVETKRFSAEDYDAAVEHRDSYVDTSKTKTLENESLIEDPTTGPEPEGAEITVAYMNGRVAPTGVQRAIESIADKLGVKLLFAEFYNADGSKAENVNGYETDDGRVVVNVFSKRQVSFIFKHELTHTLKHSKGYKLFKELVLSSTAFKEWAIKKAGVSSGAEATAILAQRAVESRAGITIKGADNASVSESDIDGRDEVLGDFIAENCFGMDDESAIKALRALANANHNIFVRLADKVRQLLDKLRGTQYDMSLRQIERRFRRVLNEKQNTLTNNETSGVQLSTNYRKRPKGLASSRKSVYDEYASNVEQWAYSSATQTGDRKIFMNPKTRKYVLLEATEANGGFIELTTGKFDKVKEFLYEYTNTATEEFDRYVQIARIGQNNNGWDNDDANHIEHEGANGEVSNRDSAERTTDRTRNTSKIGRYSEADSIDEPAFSTPKSNGKINLSVDSTAEADLSADEIREQLKNGEITVDEAMDAMQNLYGAIPKGELASRDIDVPMQTSDGKYTRRFARTVLESEHLTDEQVSDVSEDLINEVLSYVPVGNEQAVKSADAAIQNGTEYL